MPLEQSRYDVILARVESLRRQETALQSALESFMSSPISSYKFESGEGSQAVTYKSTDQMRNDLYTIQAEIDMLVRKLNGTGVYNIPINR